MEDDGHRVVIDTSDHDAAHISVHKCTPQDAGRYTCKIKNQAGEVEIPVDVEVLAPPAQVSGAPKCSNVSAKGVDLTWEPAVESGGLPTTHYVVERKEEGRQVWAPIGKTKDGKTCKFHAGGVAGKRYQYRVKAVNSAAEGKESDESKSVLLKSDFDPPGPVLGEIAKVDSTDDSITLGWEEVKKDGGSPIIGYVVEKRRKGQIGWSRCNEPEDCTKGEYRVSRLQTGTDYEFRVTAVNGAGESDPSHASRAFNASMAVAPPGEPADLEMIDSTNTSMTFGWKESDLCGGSSIIGYEIELKQESTDKWVSYSNGPIRGNRFSVRGLELGKSYQARIRTVNTGSYSRWLYCKKNLLAAATAIIPEFKLTPELEVAVRKGIQINAGSSIRIHVPYHARPRPVIRWTRDDNEVEDSNTNDMDGLSQLLVRGARRWHSGAYKIVLKNSSGSKDLTINVTVIDVPPAPVGPLVTSNITESGITLTWKKPKTDGGAPVKFYTVQKRDSRGRDWSTVTSKIKQCTYSITDLDKQRSYYFRVLAENDIGTGDPLQTTDVIFFKLKVAKVQIEELVHDERDLRKQPVVTVPLRPRKVPDGVKVTLSCSVAGKPAPSIKWFKNGNEVNDRNIFKENVIGLCRLVIKKTRNSDAGTYKMVAENEVGSAETEAVLTITD